ncbi:hypothetical protein [Patulibacter sp.]|uniref:hypothetical protein n=1 Tax=Patulibacter sp. TaxID=1912859 RepID=UPI002728C121|nr:hypothetical protein [Patulibacter sp.]MDO9410360.1 hypothetical protein [Patulibacter sp.]
MGLIYAITAAFLLFIITWALGFKQFDAILLSAGVVVLATAIWKVFSYFPNADTEVAPSNDA